MLWNAPGWLLLASLSAVVLALAAYCWFLVAM
jgi:hypothetical protein